MEWAPYPFRMVRTVLFLLAILCSSLAHGQEEPLFVVEVFPEAPTSATPVTVLITRRTCPTEFLGRTGNTLNFASGTICVLPPFNPDQHFIGLLPAGTWTVRIEHIEEEGQPPVVFTSTFVVAAATPAEVPALDAYGAIVLGVMLAGLAMRRVVA